jgi:hypothetical protein
MSSQKEGGGQEGALAKMTEGCLTYNSSQRQRMQQAAAEAAKKLGDATKEAEATARVAAAQAAHEEAQVSLSGSTTAAALSVPCLLLFAYVSAWRAPPEARFFFIELLPPEARFSLLKSL